MATPIKSVLQVSTGKFVKDMKIATKGVLALGGAFSTVIGFILKFTAVMTAAAAGVTFFINRNIQLIDRLGKVSNVTGFTVRQLQDFRLAAELSGVSSDQADIALRRFSRRLGEAGRNTGELLPALRRLGISVRDDEGNLRNVNDVLLDFADGIKATKGETAQLSLAFKAFDSEGAELVQTLTEGREGLLRFNDVIEVLGGTVSEKTIQDITALNDKITLLTNVITTLVQETIGKLAPAFNELADRILSKIIVAVAESEDGLEKLATTLATKFLQSLKSVTLGMITFYNTALVPLINGLTGLASSLNAPGFELSNLKKNLAEFKELAGQGLISRLTTLSVTSGRTAEILEEKLGKGFLLTKDNIAIAIQAIEEEIKRLESAGALDLTKLVGFDPEAIADIERVFDRLINFKEFVIIRKEPIEEVITKASMLDTMLSRIFGKERTQMFWEDWTSNGIGSITKLGALAKLVLGEQIFENLREGLEAAGVGDFVKTLSEGFVKAGTMLEDALATAIATGKSDFSALGDHIRQVLAKALVQKFITGPIMGLFQGLASGGPAKAGQPYIVGEEGPELFVPKQSGVVLPNSALRGHNAGGPGVMGGGVTNITNISAVDTQSFQQAIARDPEFIFNVSRAGSRRTPA
jgi:hypothetical protein